MNPIRGQLLIISAPSGAGKTSLIKALVEQDSRVEVSVSHTTRPKRPGEAEGINYFFVSPETFNEMRDAGAFSSRLRYSATFMAPAWPSSSRAWLKAQM